MPRLYVILFWAAALFAFVMAVLPHPPQLPAGDKFQHMLAFAVLAGLAVLAYPRASMVWLLLGLAGFGALIEIVQLIPQLHRDSDWHDWVADILAAATVFALVYAWRRKSARELKGTA